MIRTRQLFILVSQTDTGAAKVIRAVSRYPYNHVSVTLDPSLRRWYSFARYIQDAPLYSGFIRESVERFCAFSGDSMVRLYRVEIPEKKAADLEKLLPMAGKQDSGMIYNYFDALANAIGQQLPVPGCHTCLSFCCDVLDIHCTSIRQLCGKLEPYLIYEGPLTKLVPDSGSRDDVFFSKLGPVLGSLHSIHQLGTLVSRVLCHGIERYFAHRFHRTAQ